MFLRSSSDSNSHRPNVVGIVDSFRALSIARSLAPDDVDLLELRVDVFAEKENKLLEGIAELPHPLLVTVRHPQEGGTHALTVTRRRELFTRFLPHASLIDVELRSLQTLGDIVEQARAREVKIVLSHHDSSPHPRPRVFMNSHGGLSSRKRTSSS